MTVPTLEAARYSGDKVQLAALMADEIIGRQIESAKLPLKHSEIRVELLANCVRVDTRLLPAVHRAFQRVQRRLGFDYPMEAYVFDTPSINAWATEARDHVFVGLSSAAVNKLAEGELEFVLGHELGHAFFDHTEIATRRVAGELKDPRRRMQLMAWSRAAEISADRAGIIGCGDLTVATRAMFQVLSGLDISGLDIRPADLTEQWDHLANEVVDAGRTTHWQLTHPFSPLRIKAMTLFWNARRAGASPETAKSDRRSVDEEVSRLLAVMDPLARENPNAVDPMLADFFLWGGLYVALAHGELTTTERSRLASVVSPAEVDAVFTAGSPSADACLEQFSKALARRRNKLSAAEIFRIMDGIVEIAMCDETFAEPEQVALRAIATKMSVNADLIIAKRLA